MSVPIDDTLSLPVILAWIRLHWGKIVLGGVFFAIAAFFMAQLRPKTFDSAATLMVFPPMFKVPTDQKVPDQPESISEMMPQALPVEAYKAIALSAPLLDEVIRKVPLEETGVQALENSLEVELVQRGGRVGQIGYTQVLLFHAKAKSPELAAKVAQTWAEVFKEQVDAVAAKGVGETFTLLEKLHTDTKGKVEQADLALAEHQKAWNLELIKAQVAAKQKKYTDFEDDLKQTEVDLASGEMKVKTLDEELAKETKKEAYFRAPSDDAYWIAGLEKDGKPKIEPDRGLRTEVPNTNYVQIRTSVVTAKEDLEGLKAKKEAILLKLDELKKEMDALTATLSDKTVERDKLARESDSLKVSYKMVREEYEKGRMADQTQASDIIIAGKAVAPEEPNSSSPAKVVLVAAFVGMFLTGGFLFLKAISDVGLRQLAGAGELGAAPVTATSGVASDGAAGNQEEPEKRA